MQLDASELKLDQRFRYSGKCWTCAGWYSAVGHICGLADDGEKRVISRHATVIVDEVEEPTDAD